VASGELFPWSAPTLVTPWELADEVVCGNVTAPWDGVADDATELPPNPVTPWLQDAIAWSPVSDAAPEIRAWFNACFALFDAFEAGLGYFWVLDDELVAVPRPALAVADGRLHGETGPAIAWDSGRTFWSWHGVPVPRHAVEDPAAITAREIHAEANLEVRRVLLERMGYERYLREGGGKLMSDDGFGRLWRCRPMPGEAEVLVLVEVVNASLEPDGSRKRYFLRVPPHLRTARAAVAWTFGFAEPERYEPRLET
jgi:hypothetical protein